MGSWSQVQINKYRKTRLHSVLTLSLICSIRTLPMTKRSLPRYATIHHHRCVIVGVGMVVCVLDFIWISTALDNFTTGHSHDNDSSRDSSSRSRHSSKRIHDDDDDILLTSNHSHGHHHRLITVSAANATIAQPLLAGPYKQLNAVLKSYHTNDPPMTMTTGGGGGNGNSNSSGSGSSGSSSSGINSGSRGPSPPPTNTNTSVNTNTHSNNHINVTITTPAIAYGPSHSHLNRTNATAEPIQGLGLGLGQGTAKGHGLDIQGIGHDVEGDDEGDDEGMGCGGRMPMPVSLSLPPTLSYDPLVTFKTVAQLFGEGHMGNATAPYLATGTFYDPPP